MSHAAAITPLYFRRRRHATAYAYYVLMTLAIISLLPHAAPSPEMPLSLMISACAVCCFDGAAYAIVVSLPRLMPFFESLMSPCYILCSFDAVLHAAAASRAGRMAAGAVVGGVEVIRHAADACCLIFYVLRQRAHAMLASIPYLMR